MARFGLLFLRRGQWQGRQLLPAAYVAAAGKPHPVAAELPVHSLSKQMGDHAAKHYGFLWWNNADGSLHSVPRDAYWAWGLHDSLIVVIPSLDIVISRAGMSWKRGDNESHYHVLRPFLEPIAGSCLPGRR